MSVYYRIVPKSEREHIGRPVDLCSAGDILNPAAVSWSRMPHIRANMRWWGRRKRFEYWAIATPDFVFAFSFSHADYRGGLAIYVLDLHTLEEVNDGEAIWFPGRADLPETARMPMGRRTARTSVEITPNTRGTVLDLQGTRVRAHVQIHEPAGHESMGVVVPWTKRRYQYTRKDNCLRPEGWIEIDGERREIDPAVSWAALDSGRGKWPARVLWNWASGSGITDGHEIGIQLGAKWTDGTPSTENALRVDGRLEKLSHDVRWQYDTSDFTKPWTFTGPQVDLTFTPVHNRHSLSKKYFFMSREDQAFGWWDGEIRLASGEAYRVERVFGWAEEVQRRW